MLYAFYTWVNEADNYNTENEIILDSPCYLNWTYVKGILKSILNGTRPWNGYFFEIEIEFPKKLIKSN